MGLCCLFTERDSTMGMVRCMMTNVVLVLLMECELQFARVYVYTRLRVREKRETERERQAFTHEGSARSSPLLAPLPEVSVAIGKVGGW